MGQLPPLWDPNPHHNAYVLEGLPIWNPIKIDVGLPPWFLLCVNLEALGFILIDLGLRGLAKVLNKLFCLLQILLFVI